MNSHIQPATWEYFTRQPPFKIRANGLLENVYLFVYTHHFRPSEFLQKYPDAYFVGGAWLKGWEWFLTGYLVPNIRPTIHGDNNVGTPGYVFWVPWDTEYKYYDSFKDYHNNPRDKSNCVYDNNHIRSAQKVIINTNGSKPGVGAKPIQVITYWDPTSQVSVEKARNRCMTTIEKKRWMDGLKELEKHAFPAWVMQRCYQELWRPDLQERRYKIEAKRRDMLLRLKMHYEQQHAAAAEHARRRKKTTYQPIGTCLPKMSLMSLPKIEAARAVHNRIDASLAKLHDMRLVHQPAIRPSTSSSQRVDGAFVKLSNIRPAVHQPHTTLSQKVDDAFAKLNNLKHAARRPSVHVSAPSKKNAAGSKLRNVLQSSAHQQDPISSHNLPTVERSENGQAARNFYLKEKELKAKRATAKNLRVLQLQAGS